MIGLNNGGKAAAVALYGAISLVGVMVLAAFSSHADTRITVAAFTFLCSNVTTALGFLTGASVPDHAKAHHPPAAPPTP